MKWEIRESHTWKFLSISQRSGMTKEHCMHGDVEYALDMNGSINYLFIGNFHSYLERASNEAGEAKQI